MTPVIPSPTSNVSIIPVANFIRRKNNCSTRCYSLRKYTKQISYAQELPFPLSTSVRYFPHIRSRRLNHPRICSVSATGTDVAVEEVNPPVADEDSSGALENSSGTETSEISSSKEVASPTQGQTKRTRPTRKSDYPPLKNEELVPGASFTGKVKSVQPFGAFVDFGAFTDGLVHVSQLSDSFVKDVAAVVSVGQEVTVRLVEANTETGRISLTMRSSNDANKSQQSPGDGDRTRTPRNAQKSGQRRDDGKKASKFVKGQDLQGKVKNLARAGSFISLPDGEEGFLPTEEEADDGLGSLMGASTLTVDQEVSVRVLRISRGRVTLTMKKEEDVASLDSKLSRGTVHTASNPFLLAFRKNKDIAAFLDEREKDETSVKDAEPIKDVASSTDENVKQDKISKDEVGIVEDAITDASVPVADEQKEPEIIGSDVLDVVDPAVEDAVTDASVAIDEEQKEPETIASDTSDIVDPAVEDDVTDASVAIDDEQKEPETIASDTSDIVDTAVESSEVEAEASTDVLSTEESISSTSVVTDAAPTTEIDIAESEEAIVKEESQVETHSVDSPVETETVELNADESSGGTDSNEQIDAPTTEESAKEEIQATEVVANQIGTSSEADEVPVQIPSTDAIVPPAAPVVGSDVESIPVENGSINNSDGQSNALPEEDATKAISPVLVKQLRNDTGAGMMDCKKALLETGGDVIKAQEYLRKKGLASADKKASRATSEGRIGSYIHDGRIGVLIEANCETDFVSRGDIFKELVDDLAMQVAACPQVEYVNTEDVPAENVEKEKALEMQREDLLSKPEQIRSKIVEGRIRKRLEELSLLEQPFIKDDKVAVKDIVKQTIARIGENMKVKRFARFTLGEGLEKKSVDFAAEVAAQTTAKEIPAPPKEQPAVVETKETNESAPKATVSASLVKQLRDETGAGMMACKKALSETEGDLEKALEYLRKKGLSAADKKSSRIAAEGRIGSYIHDSRIGVLIEVNCETDFVGRSKEFKELVDDLAMQVVASSQVQYVSVEDIPESFVNKEKELEMQREDILSKPENIREKIVEGRVSKRLGELALLEQPFIKDDKILVKDLVKLTIANIGENIKVRRFVRFTLGESTDEETETEVAVEEKN
ncbi:polyprotein of EF-Ts, chloroplastic [Daucus carota subsp. sativus]|uniref:polyprotein of EF-Ts, chloroplastic n=1 Tax=Daucus carota subsp. sativus TaxID=79200 RepID=UPI0030832ABF